MNNCPISNSSEIEKKSRGYCEEISDSTNGLYLVGWKDNKAVYVASNTRSSSNDTIASRWSSAERKRINIKQPDIIHKYNQFMGGVDRADQNVGAYRISIRSKKWWWPLFVWVPDMVVQNSWIFYRRFKSNDMPNLDLLHFRMEIVKTYIMRYSHSETSTSRAWRGRINSAVDRIPSNIRHDHLDHYQSQLPTQRRCGMCGKNTRKGCLKCTVGLHDHCFKEWHGL